MSLSSTNFYHGPEVEVQNDVPSSGTSSQYTLEHQSSFHRPTAPSLSLFPHARNFEVKDSQINAIENANFTTINNTTINHNSTKNSDTTNNLNDLVSITLWPQVAAGAIFDSAARYPAGKCHPGTREKIIERILNWIKNPGPTKHILWIYGAAGAGKSALGHTICELLKESYPNNNGGSFFFSSGTTDRGNASKLFATLAYQLAIHFPSIRAEINNVLSLDPSLLTKSMEIQLLHLIIQPIQRCHTLLSNSPVLIIDGLDECADDSRGTTQAEIVALVSKCIDEYHLPLRFMILSRPEYWIRDAFDAAPLPRITLPISLRDDVDVDKDIKTYLTSEFEKILLKNERIMRSVALPWPPAKIIERFVEEASGQYIYAATVLKFVGNYSKHSNPQKQLAIIISFGPHRASAFSELDRLYATILSAYPEWEIMKRVLAGLLLEANPTIIKIVLDVDPDDLILVLDALSSLIEPKKRKSLSEKDAMDQALLQDVFGSLDIQGTMSFCHLSFREFLRDETRSGAFYIDLDSGVVSDHIVKGFFDMIQRNLEQNCKTQPHVFLNIDFATYHGVMQNTTFKSIWHCSPGLLLPHIINMTEKLDLYDFRRLTYMHSVFYFVGELGHLLNALQTLFDDRLLKWHEYKGRPELSVEFQAACQRFRKVIDISQARALSSLASCIDFKVTPTLVYLTEYDLPGFQLPINELLNISGVTDVTYAMSLLKQHHYIVPLWYYVERETWHPHTEQSFFGNNPGPGWRTQGTWRDLRISFAHQSLKSGINGCETNFTGGRVALSRFFDSKILSDISNKEYFQNPSNLAILRVMTDLPTWIGEMRNNPNYLSNFLLCSLLCWINRQLTNPQTVTILQDYDDTLQQQMTSVLKHIFKNGFRANLKMLCKKDFYTFSSNDWGSYAQPTSINVQPLPQGLYESKPMEFRSDSRSLYSETWNDNWHPFHNEFFGPGKMTKNTNPIIDPSYWHPYLATLLLKVLVRFLYSQIHPKFSDKLDDYEESFPYITQCLPYARPTLENLNALRAIVYLYPQNTPAWIPPEGLWHLVVEFLQKYDRYILSSDELNLFVLWLNSTEHADIKTYTYPAITAADTSHTPNPLTTITDPTQPIQGVLSNVTTLGHPQSVIDTLETWRGQKRRTPDVGTGTDCDKCGLPVDHIQDPEGSVQCRNLGCETRWFHRACCTFEGSEKWVCEVCERRRKRKDKKA